ncbi:hypothetical protein [Jannaschia sp. CCS1]|uniref:hypothetical protein n=1 Tax=Jannaschia sp. (strain CCS1) TaxID=290400 RepID=UPI000053B419|nr:hypothetical protein [Jannaschia sp. CCS1]ABD53725.1 hypothetical protein Jann_0808 [Jannaschia sp. CCS1]
MRAMGVLALICTTPVAAQPLQQAALESFLRHSTDPDLSAEDNAAIADCYVSRMSPGGLQDLLEASNHIDLNRVLIDAPDAAIDCEIRVLNTAGVIQ